jgi:hypothetical protein
LQLRRASGRSAVFRSTKPSSSSFRVAKVRRTYIQPQLNARAAVDNSSQPLQARDQKRTEVLEKDKKRSVVREGNVKLTAVHSGRTGSESLVEYPQKKESKFIAAIKKTGRILSRPFRF